MGWQSTPVRPSVTQRVIDSTLRFVWLTDFHVDAYPGTRATNFAAAMTFCAEQRPAALIASGDLSPDGERILLETTCYKLRDAQATLVMIPGNHDEEENTFGVGIPNTAELEKSNTFNQPNPFYHAEHISSGDGTLTALCLCLDNNFYNGYATPSAYHVTGDRVGVHSLEGNNSRQLGAAQLAWVEATLAADRTSQIVIVVTHYNGAVFDYDQLADKLYADGRPTFGLCGHTHPNAVTTTITTTTGGHNFTFYKAPAMQESGAYVWVELRLSAGSIVFDTLQCKNYTNPGGWTINAPFT